MTYNIFNNTGELDNHFRFVRIDNEKISLKYIDNTFLKNKRLSVRFDYYELRPIESNINWVANYLNKNVKLILGVTFHTGVELKRELSIKFDFDGIIINFFSGSHILNEDILIIDTSEDYINNRINLKEESEENNTICREPISQSVQDKVWNRDGGRCVKCGSNIKLEFDHIIPFSKGGANTYRNLQLLCEKCNRKKSNKIG